MNHAIRQLSEIAVKQEKLIIGLMSGTSLDGLDIALCKISGTGAQTELVLQAFKTVPYPVDIASALQSVAFQKEPELQDITVLHSFLGDYHADLVLETLREWDIEPANIDCIASHGQTIYHAPKSRHGQEAMPHATLQIGDGDHIARKTGILTISDFRQKHTAAGGEGAPMVALIDELLFRDEIKSRVLLNIGGIANFTYLPTENEDQEVVTTDVGPGNVLINQAMQQLYDQSLDKNGETAGQGTVQPELLKQMLEDDFFSLPAPKTTGPELFNWDWVQQQMKKAGVNEIADADVVATVTWLTAQTICDAIRQVSGDDTPEVYLSGGGMHNTQLVKWLEQLLKRPVHSFEKIGFLPDAKEAVCFAVLANELLSGNAFTINPKQNTGRRVNFGKISLPV